MDSGRFELFWTLDAYPRFLEARCRLLAEAANELMRDLIGEYR